MTKGVNRNVKCNNSIDSYILCGINHFIQKYGISLFTAENLDSKNLKEITIQTEDGERTFIEILKKIGYALSGQLDGEWKRMDKDEKEKLAKVPIVDYYEEYLISILRTTHEPSIHAARKVFWPKDKKFAVCLTHDVDEIKKTYQYITHTLRYLRDGNLSRLKNQFLSLVKKVIKGEEPYWTFDEIMDLEQRLGVRSTFYFLIESGKVKLFDRSTWRHYGRKYDITDEKIVDLMKMLHSEGWEIGLHGSFYSYNNISKLKKEKEMLEKVLDAKVYGIRQHNLNLDIPNTWRIHEKLGFEYDTTLGFNECVGFRWGTCFPFHPFDIEVGEPMKLLEIPLVIEDIALFSYENPWDVCMDIINVVEECGGVLTLLWHHSVFNELEYPGWAEIYERIIKVCKEEGAWVTNAYEIAKWWRMREESVLKCEYDGHTLK